MELGNKYFNQANFFTRSVFNLERDIHKDILYLIQSKIDFFGATKDIINISFNDYLTAKNVCKNNTYSFEEFCKIADEVKSIGGAFYNKINSSFVSFNIIDNIQIDLENSESLKIELAKFGKIFFYKKNLEAYIKEITPAGKPLKYTGHTQIENSTLKFRGLRRKKFFELISQFKNTGYFKIRLIELKMYLGYIQIIDSSTKEPLSMENQMKFIFIPNNKFEFLDKYPIYSRFENDFLKGAIENINSDSSKDINNLVISRKIKTGRKITHLEFKFNALGKDLTEEEITCLNMFLDLKLDKQQVLYLLKRIGYKEMYGRWMKNIERKVLNNSTDAKFYDRRTNKEIHNIPGYLYKSIFPELQKS